MESLLSDACKGLYLLRLGFLHNYGMLSGGNREPRNIFLSGTGYDYDHHDLVALPVFWECVFFSCFFPNPGGSAEGGDDEFLDVRLAFSNSCCWSASTSTNCFSKLSICCPIPSTSFWTLALCFFPINKGDLLNVGWALFFHKSHITRSGVVLIDDCPFTP